jgi:coniferyl-aldehyde dehydrogenase
MNTDLRRMFDAQRAAWTRTGAPSKEARIDALGRLASMLTRHGDQFAVAICADFGNRATQETQLLELLPMLNALRHTRRHLARWMRPERRHVAWMFKPGKAWVQYQPLGVVGIISPWNYPLLLALACIIHE